MIWVYIWYMVYDIWYMYMVYDIGRYEYMNMWCDMRGGMKKIEEERERVNKRLIQRNERAEQRII